MRAYAARRLWRSINGRSPRPAFHQLSKQRGERLSAAIRALDAHSAGASYRVIAEALFGKKRVPDRAWKTHDLRNRTIRLGARRPRVDARWLPQISAAWTQGRMALPLRGIENHPLQVRHPL
ncbi:DUF2285 domain-containing protein [Bradyrhizobium sp. CIR3A]|uniref:DUF2285 domain-containing protein n=1 Tax=Bradyrhizobium sp. CIR3A TaxID=2663838 RepID=UPI00289ABD1A|nr:DUF2285 domain-containing protein [Bradyrhizobium sp. CIR3A]